MTACYPWMNNMQQYRTYWRHDRISMAIFFLMFKVFWICSHVCTQWLQIPEQSSLKNTQYLEMQVINVWTPTIQETQTSLCLFFVSHPKYNLHIMPELRATSFVHWWLHLWLSWLLTVSYSRSEQQKLRGSWELESIFAHILMSLLDYPWSSGTKHLTGGGKYALYAKRFTGLYLYI